MLDLTVFPHELSDLAIWMSVDSWTISKVVDELSFVTLAICPCIGSITYFYVF